MKKPIAFYILGILLLILSLNGIAGGALLIAKPDGSLLGMQPDWLGKSPFQTFLIPGILLLFFNGILPGTALFGILTRKKSDLFQKSNIFSDKLWGWTWSLYCGIITISWIIIQQLITDYFILQPIIAALGLLIVIVTLTPRVQKYYSEY